MLGIWLTPFLTWLGIDLVAFLLILLIIVIVIKL